MSDNTITSHDLHPAGIGSRGRADVVGVSVRARLTAWLRADHLDALLAVGAAEIPGSALAIRAARLTSRGERNALARTLSLAVSDAHDRTAVLTRRVPVHRQNVAAAEDRIGDIVARLQSPGPVNARGMARLRRVLSDGRGPMYRFGHGDLTGRLGAAMAAL